MPHVQPLFLPKQVVEENGLALENDFGVEPRQFYFGPDGRLYVLSTLFYNYHRYDHGDERYFFTFLVNVYGPDLAPERIADFSSLCESSKGAGKFPDYFDWDRFDPYLAVTPGNFVVLTTQSNRAFLFDAQMEARVGQFAAPDSGNLQQVYDQGFAYHIEPSGEGGLLCVVSEPGVRSHWFSPNLICLPKNPALGPDSRPELMSFACLESRPSADAIFPYIRLPNGARAGKGNRPTPSLAEQVGSRFGLSLLFSPWIGQALPLDRNRCLVSLFSERLRGGSKGLGFVFAMVSHDGRVIGRVEGIDQYAESPFVEHHYRLAVDQVHGRIVYKNKTSFFLFDLEGQPLSQVRLEGKLLSGMAALKLGGCSPEGRIILYHPKQHPLVATDPVAAPGDLASALAETVALLPRERNRLKKQHEWAHSRWLHPGSVVRH